MYKKTPRFLKGLVGLFIVTVIFMTPKLTGALTQSYQTDDTALLPGMVVSLSSESSVDNPVVKRAGLSDARKLVGVSTTIEESLVTVSRANRPVFVVTDGEVEIYVVDSNGEIKAGDQLRLSSIRGVVEKADQEGGVIIGTALEDADFVDAESFIAVGEEETANVKAVKITIAINNQALTSAGAESQQKSGLAQLGFSITGKNIGEIRMLIALVIFLIVMVAEGGIIYGAISSAITSLGRNPLAKKIIRQELVRVLLVAVVVLSVGIASIYAILFI